MSKFFLDGACPGCGAEKPKLGFNSNTEPFCDLCGYGMEKGIPLIEKKDTPQPEERDQKCRPACSDCGAPLKEVLHNDIIWGQCPKCGTVWQAQPNTNSALKHDQEKPPMSLLPFEALEEVAKALRHGAEIYGDHNWRGGFRWSRLESAMLRHYAAYQRGEDEDPESGCLHLAHLCCCALFLLTHQLLGLGEDDRHGSNK